MDQFTLRSNCCSLSWALEKREDLGLTPYDFGLGVLASWLANRLEVASIKTESTSVEDLSLNIEAIADLKLERKKLFHSFDVFTQLHEVSEGLASPVAHLLIEAEPPLTITWLA